MCGTAYTLRRAGGGGGACPRGESHRSVVNLDVGSHVDELDELEVVVLTPTFVGLRRAHVVQVDALVHLILFMVRKVERKNTYWDQEVRGDRRWGGGSVVSLDHTSPPRLC